MGLPLSERQIQQLLDYLSLLQRWNKVYNLTAVREPARMLTHHLVDSLAIWAPLQRQVRGAVPGPGTSDAPLRLLDAGSGGGLPGVVLALLAPDWQITCADAVAKKVGFVRQVAGELGLSNLRAEHGRLEAWRPEVPFDIVVSRAFASLADFTRLTRHLLAPAGIWLAMKGAIPDAELEALPQGTHAFHVEPLEVPGLDARRCIVWMRIQEPNP
jgi:16S rRNA (guanine527-N7)-methyltransferase